MADTCYKLGNHDGFPQPEICFILTHKKLKHLAKNPLVYKTSCSRENINVLAASLAVYASDLFF